MKILTEEDFLSLKEKLNKMDEEIQSFKDKIYQLIFDNKYGPDVVLNTMLCFFVGAFERMHDKKIIDKNTIGFDKVKRIYEAIIKEVGYEDRRKS